jgi:L-methionine (R)-S-oxide reductase
MRDDTTLPAKLSEILASKADRAVKAAQIAEAIRTAGCYRWVGLYDVDHTRGLVSNIAWSGPAAPAYPTFPITKGLTSRAIAEKRTVNVGDAASDPNYLTALNTTRSEIILPILNKAGIVIGTLDVESEQPNAFTFAKQAELEECALLLTSFWTAA